MGLKMSSKLFELSNYLYDYYYLGIRVMWKALVSTWENSFYTEIFFRTYNKNKMKKNQDLYHIFQSIKYATGFSLNHLA